MEFVETGVPNLDLVLGGGLVAGSLTMVTGEPGCGKTILTQQIAVHAARQGRQVLVLTTLSEPHTKLLTYLRTLASSQRALRHARVGHGRARLGCKDSRRRRCVRSSRR